MISRDQITVTDSGTNYTVGELKAQDKSLTYLKPTELVGLFDGLDTLLDYVAKNMATPRNDKSSSREGVGGFNAFKTYEEAMDIFRNKPEQVSKFDPTEIRVQDDSESGTSVEYDVTGDYIDMGRYMEGVPESVGTMTGGRARNRRANIIVDLNQRSGMDFKDIIKRGERTLRLVDALELGGVRTQLTGVVSNQCVHVEVILKRHEDPLTITDLAVATHSEFLRRIMFRVDEYSKTWDYGHGSAIAFGRAIDSDPKLLKSDNNDEMNILIGSNIEGIDTIDKRFDDLELLLAWELSKSEPEVDAIRVDKYGVSFNPNGYRADAEIKREGQEVLSGRV